MGCGSRVLCRQQLCSPGADPAGARGGVLSAGFLPVSGAPAPPWPEEDSAWRSDWLRSPVCVVETPTLAATRYPPAMSFKRSARRESSSLGRDWPGNMFNFSLSWFLCIFWYFSEAGSKCLQSNQRFSEGNDCRHARCRYALRT